MMQVEPLDAGDPIILAPAIGRAVGAADAQPVQHGEEHRPLQREAVLALRRQSRSITARQPVSSHSRSKTRPARCGGLAIFVALSSATAVSTIALLAKRAPERNSRSSCPLACSSSRRPSVAITCWRTWSPSRRLSTICR